MIRGAGLHANALAAGFSAQQFIKWQIVNLLPAWTM